MKYAYIDCFCGAAGDMLTAALLDNGLDKKELENALRTLQLEEFQGVKVERVIRSGISAVKFEPLFEKHSHKHGHSDGDGHRHTHGDGDGHSHEHNHGHHKDYEHKHNHNHGSGAEHAHAITHHHRNLQDIVCIIEHADLPAKVRKDAVAVFNLLAKAEAQVHGREINDIHFHEVGASDSILDVVSVCFGLHYFGIERVSAGTLSVGGGVVKCAHGIMPVPAPATLNLLHNIPFTGGPVEKELLTPTAAALLKYFVSDFGPMPVMTVESTGYGAGTMEFENIPNTVRITIGNIAETAETLSDKVVMLETDIDDAAGEPVGHLAEMLRSAGALDVLTIPVFMKNSRPGVRLSVLARPADGARLEEIIFKSGLTLGLRKQNITRSTLPRSVIQVQTPYGAVNVKTATYNGLQVSVKPEFTQCAAAAEEHNVPVKRVISAAIESYNNQD